MADVAAGTARQQCTARIPSGRTGVRAGRACALSAAVRQDWL